MKKLAFIAVLLVAAVAAGEQADHSASVPSGGATVFGFSGERSGFEIASSVGCVFKIQYRISGTWTDYQPDGGSPQDTYRLPFGGSWSKQFPNFSGSADSTRVLLTPVSTAAVVVVAH